MKLQSEKCFQVFSKKAFRKWVMVKICGNFRGKILGKIPKAEFPRISEKNFLRDRNRLIDCFFQLCVRPSYICACGIDGRVLEKTTYRLDVVSCAFIKITGNLLA